MDIANKKGMDSRSRLLGTVLAVTFLLSGCEFESLISDVKEFDKVVSISALALQKTYSGVNDFCRDSYISRLQYNPTISATHRNQDKSYQVLVYAYSPEDIRARQLVLQGLIEYCAGLEAIAGSDSATQAGQIASQIAERLTNTADTLRTLSEESRNPAKGGSKSTFNFADYSKPLSDLAKIAATYWVKKMQKDALKKCIREGYGTAERAFSDLQTDLKDLIHYAYEENAELTLAMQENYYNSKYVFAGEKPAKTDPAYAEYMALIMDKGRLECLTNMKNSGKTLADLSNSSPEPIIKAMREAHQRLKKYFDKEEQNSEKAGEQENLQDVARGDLSCVLEAYRNVRGNLIPAQ